MSSRFERILKRRSTELLITIVLLALALSLIILSFGPFKDMLLVRLGEKLAFAMLVALVVRWIGIAFAETEQSDDSSYTEYLEAIENARDHIYLCQTWLPGTERDAQEIRQSKAAKKQILLASFKDGSPIFARATGRKLTLAKAQDRVMSSVRPLLDDKAVEFRFNYGHQPGWIAVIDSSVFWGPTPVHIDNQSIQFLFHRHAAGSAKGDFWTSQFRMLWENFSHDMETEKLFNPELKEL